MIFALVIFVTFALAFWLGASYALWWAKSHGALIEWKMREALRGRSASRRR